METFRRVMIAMVCSALLYSTTVQAHATETQTQEVDAYRFVEQQHIMSVGDTADRAVNRAELLKILFSSMSLSHADVKGCSVEGMYKDVSREHWFASFVCLGTSLGIVNGFFDGTFRAGDSVTFVEAAKILAPLYDAQIQEGVAVWYEPYVTYLDTAGAIPYTVQSLVHPMTRGEIAHIVFALRTKQALSNSNKYDAQSQCILRREGMFYASTQKEVYFFPPMDTRSNDIEILQKEIATGSGIRIAEADAQSFIVSAMPFYAHDKAHVYYQNSVLEEASVDDFVTLDDRYGYAKDARTAYYKGKKIMESDAASFIELDQHYAKDATHVYYAGSSVSGADSATFTVLPNGYAKDAQHVFYRTALLNGADSSTFSVLNVDYAMDAFQVYYQDKIIQGAMGKSFLVLRDQFATDGRYIFFEDTMLTGATAENFEILEGYYAKTTDTVYYGSYIIPEAHAPSFTAERSGKATDKNFQYYMGQKLVESVK